VDVDHLLLVDGLLLLIQVIHDKEIGSLSLVQVDPIDVVEVRLAVMDDVPCMIASIEDVLAGVDKHFELVRNLNFEGNQEYVSLLIQNHSNILELEALVNILF